MSILIKGAEMPENCHECPCLRHDSWDGLHRYQCNNKLIAFGECDSWSYERRPNWCPLVELPEKHGKLIDADAMERLMSETVQGNIRNYPYSDTTWDTAFQWMDHQPTIVEAEGD